MCKQKSYDGIFGFRKDGIDKTTQHSGTATPRNLGAKVKRFCIDTSVEEMEDICDRIEMIKYNTVLPLPELQKMRDLFEAYYQPLYVSLSMLECLNYVDGDLTWYRRGLKYMIDSVNFIKYSKYCDWGFIINLDTQQLETWRGGNQGIDTRNRYGVERDVGGYGPCKLVSAVSIPELKLMDDYKWSQTFKYIEEF